MSIKIINNIKSPLDTERNSYKINLTHKKTTINNDNSDECNYINDCKDIFNVGQLVKHTEENINGKIKHIGTKITIVWEDNTRERISFNDAIAFLEIIDIDSTNNIENNVDIDEENCKSNKIDKEIDIEKIKLERKVNQLENKLIEKKSTNVKEKMANELIDLMIDKNIINDDDKEIEFTKIIVMSDDEFDEYRKNVIEFDNLHVVTSSNDDFDIIDDPVLTDAEKALQKIKSSGGKGIIGDFSNYENNNNNEVVETREIKLAMDNNKRSLGEINDTKFTFSNREIPPTFEEQFVDILSNKLINSANKQEQQQKIAAKQEKNNELPGFENLKGLTKPIQIREHATSFPTNTPIKDLMENLNWTVISKLH